MTRLRLGVREHIRPEPRINGHRHARGHCQLEAFVASPVESSASRSVIFNTSVFASSCAVATTHRSLMCAGWSVRSTATASPRRAPARALLTRSAEDGRGGSWRGRPAFPDRP